MAAKIVKSSHPGIKNDNSVVGLLSPTANSLWLFERACGRMQIYAEGDRGSICEICDPDICRDCGKLTQY